MVRDLAAIFRSGGLIELGKVLIRRRAPAPTEAGASGFHTESSSAQVSAAELRNEVYLPAACLPVKTGQTGVQVDVNAESPLGVGEKRSLS